MNKGFETMLGSSKHKSPKLDPPVDTPPAANPMITALLSILFLLVGLIIGWTIHEKYIEYLHYNTHEFEKIIQQNPHPEIFDDTGKVNREEYLCVNFELGFDPDQDWDGEELYIED